MVGIEYVNGNDWIIIIHMNWWKIDNIPDIFWYGNIEAVVWNSFWRPFQTESKIVKLTYNIGKITNRVPNIGTVLTLREI